MIKVRATMDGYFGDNLIKAGESFTIDNEKQFSKRWMEKEASGQSGGRPRKGKGQSGDESPEDPAE